VQLQTEFISGLPETVIDICLQQQVASNVTKPSFAYNAARNCRSELAAFLRFFAKKKTDYGGQICWPC